MLFEIAVRQFVKIKVKCLLKACNCITSTKEYPKHPDAYTLAEKTSWVPKGRRHLPTYLEQMDDDDIASYHNFSLSSNKNDLTY